MKAAAKTEASALERLWGSLFLCFSAVMGAFALVSLDAGRLAGAAGDAGVSCLMLSLGNQFPMLRAIVAAASRQVSPAKLQEEAERLRSAHPWSERIAAAGWALLFASLLLRALGVD